MIEAHLQKLGLREREIQAFTCLIEANDPLSISELGKRCSIPRSTAYHVVESLIERGFILAEELDSTTRYRINNPANFVATVEREKEQLLQRESTLQQLVQIVSAKLENPDAGVPKAQFYSGKQNIEKMMFADREKWRKSIAKIDKTWWGYQDDAFVKQYQNWFENTWQTTPENELVKLFSNQSETELKRQGKIEGRVIRAVPEGFAFSSTIWVLGDFIVMIATHQKPHHAFQLDDRVFGENLRTVFRLLWSFTK